MIMKLTNEQIQAILDGAPDWQECYCTESKQRFPYDNYRNLSDLREILTLRQEVEQLQQRNAELESKTACCMGVGNGNGRLFVYGDHYSIKTMQRYILEKEELAATVERYDQVITDARAAFNSQYHIGNDQIAVQMSEALDIDMDESYESILNAVKREVYADGYYDGYRMAWLHDHDSKADHDEYASEQSEIESEKLYPSGKDGE